MVSATLQNSYTGTAHHNNYQAAFFYTLLFSKWAFHSPYKMNGLPKSFLELSLVWQNICAHFMQIVLSVVVGEWKVLSIHCWHP